MTPLARSAIVDRMRVFHGRALVVGYAALATACSTPFGAPAPIAEPSLVPVPQASVTLPPVPDPVELAAPSPTPPTTTVGEPPADLPPFALVATPTPLGARDPLAIWLAPRIQWDAEEDVDAWPEDARYVRAHAGGGHDVVVVSRGHDATEQHGCMRGPWRATTVALSDGVPISQLPHPDGDDDVLPMLHATLWLVRSGWDGYCLDDACLDEIAARWAEDGVELAARGRLGTEGTGAGLHLLAVVAARHRMGGRHGPSGTRYEVSQLDVSLDESGAPKVTTLGLADVERPDPSPEVVVDSFDAVR